MASSGFYGMSFTTELQGQKAIDVLAQFAPRNIQGALNKQVNRLDEIHDTGKMPNLGVVGGYRWHLAVWSIPSPLHICLWTAHANLSEQMSLDEALKIEQEACKRAGKAAQRQVAIMPRDFRDRKLQDRMWDNVRRGYHWSRGL